MVVTIVEMSLTEDLLSLYRVDSQLRGLRTRVDNAKRTLKIREQQLADLVERCEETSSNSRQLQATIGNLEGEANDFKDRVDKLRSELNAATNDKQYQAILAEMKSLEEHRDTIDEQNLAEMERLEALKSSTSDLEEQIKERTALRDVAMKECTEREAEIADRVQDLEKERAVACESIPANALEIFDRVADATEGETLSPVIELNKKRHEFACGVCNIEVPYNLVVTLHAGGTSIQQCPACMRILYLEPSEEAAEATT